MIRTLVTLLCAGVLALLAGAGVRPAVQDRAEAGAPVRFEAHNVVIDPAGRALGAYQVEFRATRGDVTIVGVEGGEHAAFAQAPFYDPAAIQNERAILGAFSTDAALPDAPTRVARVHVRIAGDVAPEFAVELHAAADAEGERFGAEVTTTRATAADLEGDEK